jgi:hypothetical protein
MLCSKLLKTRSIDVSRIINISLIVIAVIVLSACGTQKSLETAVISEQDLANEVVNPYPDQQITDSTSNVNNPYPIYQPTQSGLNSAYPGPAGQVVSSTVNLDAEFFVSKLIVPTPTSGMGVITGQLLIGRDTNQPFLTTVYLAPILPAPSADLPPIVNFSMQSDPIAKQELSTGRFMFTDVTPGQYALVVSIPSESFIIKDSKGNNLIIEVKPNEVKDIGTIYPK